MTKDFAVTVVFKLKELEQVIQALLDQEDGISQLTDQLIERYENATDQEESING